MRNFNVRLEPSLQVKHLKRWKFFSLIRTEIVDRAPAGSSPPSPVVTGGVYGFSPAARRLAGVAVASLHRMRAFLKLLVDLKLRVATVEVPRIIDLDHKRDLVAAESWLAAAKASR